MECIKKPLSVAEISRERRVINMDPVYQREGGVWSKDKKQLFIDSLVNRFDIPKIYVHVVSADDAGFKYAVVDGKQRISTVLAFMDSSLEFAPDFSYSGRPCAEPPKPGQTFKDLAEEARDIIKEIFLDFVLVEANDEDEIEELFSRLNNGEKLNAAESRNAFGGNMARLVRALAEESFFKEKIAFANKRYSHYEITCKLLYLEHSLAKSGGDGLVDLKKKHLDQFVNDYKNISEADAKKLYDAVAMNLKAMSPVFELRDIELSKQSYPQLMYVFTRHMLGRYGAVNLKDKIKTFLAEFRLDRMTNLKKDEDSRDAELTDFGRLMQQGTNDASSMTKRLEILVKRFLRSHPDVALKDTRRGFNTEERWALWQLADKRCSLCGTELESLSELDADHIQWHVESGPTSLDNARALCVPCNRGHGGVSPNQASVGVP